MSSEPSKTITPRDDRPYTKEDFMRDLTKVSRPLNEKPCNHCWHQWGSGIGGISSDGSSESRGANRCCHCGEILEYHHKNGPVPKITHGQYLAEIIAHAY